MLTIIGVILGSGMAMLVAGTQAAQYNATVNTMNTIEQTLLNYVVAFNRLPCPSLLTALPTSSNYGVEAANPGTGNCTATAVTKVNGTYAAAEGGVPTVSLKLPDSYMYDAWGRRIRYAVDTSLTKVNSAYPNYGCTPGSSNTCIGTGANAAFPPAIGGCNTGTQMTVYDSTGAIRSNNAAYVLVSHGANGHGAYTSAGTIINAGSTNNAEQSNCHCSSTASNNTYNAQYYQEALSTTTASNAGKVFDDIVSFKEPWQLRNGISPVPTATSCSAYAHTIPITINASYVSTVSHTNLTSFPMLFTCTSSSSPACNTYLSTTANGGYAQSSSGYDIVFTSDAVGQNILPFERENYDPVHGYANFWVQIPTLSASSNTIIYLNIGSSTVTTDQSNAAGTWNSNYAAAWHLDETSGTQYDSTSNNDNITGPAYAAQGETTTAMFGGADQFVTTSQTGYNGQLPANLLPTNLTVSAWVNMATFNTGSGNIDTLLAADHLATPWAAYVMYLNNSKQACFTWYNTSKTAYNACGSTALSANTWYYLVGTYTPNTLSIYVNGSLAGSVSTTGTIFQATQTFGIGCNGNSSTGCSQDYIDETRVVDTTLSLLTG